MTAIFDEIPQSFSFFAARRLYRVSEDQECIVIGAGKFRGRFFPSANGLMKLQEEQVCGVRADGWIGIGGGDGGGSLLARRCENHTRREQSEEHSSAADQELAICRHYCRGHPSACNWR